MICLLNIQRRKVLLVGVTIIKFMNEITRKLKSFNL